LYASGETVPSGPGPLHPRGCYITYNTHYSRWESSRRVISSPQRSLRDNTRQSQQTDINARGGIQTHNLSRRMAADPHLRPRGQWDGKVTSLKPEILLNNIYTPNFNFAKNTPHLHYKYQSVIECY